MNKKLGWHFTAADCTLGYGDNRKVIAGQTIKHKYDEPLIMCRSGLHASKRVIDALAYAPGAYVWRVELGGEIVSGADKMVAMERTALWGYNAADVLHCFARKCALDVVHLWDAPDVVVRYLKTGDESIVSAAYSAAYSAYSAAGSAAYSAAYSAARTTQSRRLASMISAGRE